MSAQPNPSRVPNLGDVRREAARQRRLANPSPPEDPLSAREREVVEELVRQVRLAFRAPKPLDEAAFRWGSRVDAGRLVPVLSVGFSLDYRDVLREVSPADEEARRNSRPYGAPILGVRVFTIGGKTFAASLDLARLLDEDLPGLEALGAWIASSLAEQVRLAYPLALKVDGPAGYYRPAGL